jgi:Fe-S-cluster formation regulator IscX/YfhJ
VTLVGAAAGVAVLLALRFPWEEPPVVTGNGISLVPVIVTGVIALFSGAAAAAFVAGMFSRPKVRAEATAAVITAQATVTSSDATVVKAIQEAASALVVGIREELDRVRERCARNEARMEALQQWRNTVEDLLDEHDRWDEHVLEAVRKCSETHGWADPVFNRPAPPLRPKHAFPPIPDPGGTA